MKNLGWTSVILYEGPLIQQNNNLQSLFYQRQYALQLLGRVRCQEETGMQKDLRAIQLAQNKLARLFNNVKISDRQSTCSLLDKINMLSVNQINA